MGFFTGIPRVRINPLIGTPRVLSIPFWNPQGSLGPRGRGSWTLLAPQISLSIPVKNPIRIPYSFGFLTIPVGTPEDPYRAPINPCEEPHTDSFGFLTIPVGTPEDPHRAPINPCEEPHKDSFGFLTIPFGIPEESTGRDPRDPYGFEKRIDSDLRDP